MNLVFVSVAENTDIGEKSGIASVFDFGDCLRLEAKNAHGYPFSHIRTSKGFTRFRIHRNQFPYHQQIEWYGNIIYNGYQMEVYAVCDLINHLWRSGNWNIEHGDSELIDFLEQNNLLFRGDFERILSNYILINK